MNLYQQTYSNIEVEGRPIFILSCFKTLTIQKHGRGVKYAIFNDLEIKHDFLYINICWAPREMLETRAWKARVSTRPEGPSKC